MFILRAAVHDKWGILARAAVWRGWWGFQRLFSLQRAVQGHHSSPSQLFWKAGWRESKDMFQGTGVFRVQRGLAEC